MIYYYKKKTLEIVSILNRDHRNNNNKTDSVVIRVIDNNDCVGNHLVRTWNYQNAQTSLVLRFTVIQRVSGGRT